VTRKTKISLKLFISISLITYLICKYGAEFVQLFSKVDGLWIAGALGFMTLSNVLGTLQWNLILKNLDIHLPFKRAFAFYYSGLFFNNFLLSFIGGDVVRIYDITKTSGRNSEAITTVFLDRLIGLFMMTLFAAVAMLYTIGLIQSNVIVILIALIFIVVSFVLVFLFSKPFAKKFESFGKSILPKRFHGRIREIYNSLNYYGNHPVLIGRLIILSFMVQSARICVHYCTSRSLGVTAGIEYFFLFIPIITVIITFPISIGGIGVRESTAAMLFQYAGVSAATAVMFEGLAYGVAILCSIPGGIMFIFRKHELKRE